MMSKLMKLNTKSTSVFKKEDEQSNLEDKTHQQKEIRELLKSETMITRNIKTLNKEKSRPNIQRMKFTIGTQLNTSPKTAIINPAVPIPLLEL